MLGKILPILLALVGTGAGVGAGLMLKSDPPPEEQQAAAAVDCLPPEGTVDHAPPPDEEETDTGREYVKLNNQFIVPVVDDDRVRALIVAALSVEVKTGQSETVYAKEPKLRDVFLQVLMDHANIGGFEGNFTTGERMTMLRTALMEAARPVLGSDISDVLITEIARQDN